MSVYWVFLEIKVELSVERFYCPDLRIRFKTLQSRDHEHIFGFDWRVSSRTRINDLLIQIIDDQFHIESMLCDQVLKPSCNDDFAIFYYEL